MNQFGETSVSGIFAAGDVTGIEEASSAMISGRIAGAAAALRAGYISQEEHDRLYTLYQSSLDQLRQGMCAGANKGNPKITATDEGIPLSASLLAKGYLEEDEISNFPGCEAGGSGFHPVVECTQNIPCNPCQDVCPKRCITVGDRITNLPVVHPEVECINCGLCVSACPGPAIFLVNEDLEPGYGAVSLPYEFRPLPAKGEKGTALDRSGKPVCPAEIVDVKITAPYDRTPILTMKVPANMTGKARFFARESGSAR